MRSGVETARGFIDDITAGGTCRDWPKLWEQSLRLLRTFATHGFMINLRKCKFCVPHVVVLGLELLKIGYRLCSKFL